MPIAHSTKTYGISSANDQAGAAGTIIGASIVIIKTSLALDTVTGSAKGSGGSTSRNAGINHRLYASRGPKWRAKGLRISSTASTSSAVVSIVSPHTSIHVAALMT